MGDSACARPVEGLFLPSDCTRMALAVKQETDKSNLVNVLDGSGPFAKACSQPRGKGLSNRSMSPVIANSLSPIPPTVLSPLIPAPQRLTSARRFEMSRGRSLPGTSLAAETKLVFGTAPSRSRLCISTLRFRAARVSKRILFTTEDGEVSGKSRPFRQECPRHVGRSTASNGLGIVGNLAALDRSGREVRVWFVLL
jgi:hypothetical protein